MKRRNFLKKTALTAASTIFAPYILPSGRLFARTGSRKVNHVVFCLFAGGVRNIESIHQNEGNLLPSLFDGPFSTNPGIQFLGQSPWVQALQHEGTLFPEFRYQEGPTGHFNGHTVAVTGAYTDTSLNVRENPQMPTIFEYYLKHNSPSQTALNAWWVSNNLGPYPALNYSKHPDYGSRYGGNHISPPNIFDFRQLSAIDTPAIFQFHEEEMIGEIQDFLNKNSRGVGSLSSSGIRNTAEDDAQIQAFIQSTIQQVYSGAFSMPFGLSPNFLTIDMLNILFTQELLKHFQPELLVVNMTDIDVCHSNYTEYCNALVRADFAVAHLWNTIQSTPGLADDTILIIAPEHGRNLEPNTLQDVYGRFAIDHTSDATSREIFCMILGPQGIVNKGNIVGSASNPVGESIDIVPTIANILGFDVDIPSGLLTGSTLQQAFV